MVDKIRIDQKYDLHGNYEPTDSENEYSAGETKILEKIKKKHYDSDSEQEVYKFSESDDDSDNQNDNIADSDIEGQEQSDDDLPDIKAWGKKKKSYYSTDYVDQDYGGFGNEEQAALLEEQEAKILQKKLLEQLAEEDFTLDFFNVKKTVDDENVTVVKSDLSQLSKRRKIELFEKESPEFAGLVDDFKNKLIVAKDNLQPVLELVKDGKLPTCPASKFVETNYELILNYCTNISFYLLLKSQRVNIQNHPIIKRLFQYRQVLNKLEPIYLEVIKPQIDHILNSISNNIELQFEFNEKGKNNNKKRKSVLESESEAKKLKIITRFEKDEAEDTGVSDNEDEYEGNDYFMTDKNVHKTNDESEESGFSDNDEISKDPLENENKPSTSSQGIIEDSENKRKITYQIAKNKGLTPHRKKEQRNPRVKHKLKYRKAKIRRRGAIRDPRTEISRYGGETSGIKANVKKSIKIK